MDQLWIIELSIGVGAIAVGTFLAVYIKKMKDKLKKSVLRNHED
jgi:hypothetical protein